MLQTNNVYFTQPEKAFFEIALKNKKDQTGTLKIITVDVRGIQTSKQKHLSEIAKQSR